MKKTIATIMLVITILMTFAISAFAVEPVKPSDVNREAFFKALKNYPDTKSAYVYNFKNVQYVVILNKSPVMVYNFAQNALGFKYTGKDGFISLRLLSYNSSTKNFDFISTTENSSTNVGSAYYNCVSVPLAIDWTQKPIYTYGALPVTAGDYNQDYSSVPTLEKPFAWDNLASTDFLKVLNQLKVLIPIIIPAVVGFIAFRKGWGFLKSEVSSA